jgi:peptidyl-prolyl cis-trans isomerase D
MLAAFRSALFVKAMMWIVAFSFVALIVFEWGADFSSTGGRGSSNLVGVVNGQDISYERFEQQLRNAHRLEKNRGVADPDFSRLIQQEWEALITQTIFAEQLAHYQIEASDHEVNFLNRNSPPPEIRNIEFFKTEDKFDFAKYHQFLDSPTTYADLNNKQIVLYAENRAREMVLTGKLQNLVAGSVKVSDSEVRRAWLNKNEKVRVEYVGIEAAKMPDSLITFEESELLAYYETNRDDFHEKESIRASFVSFPKAPTARDEIYAQDEIHRIREELDSGGDFADLATEYSDDPGSAQRGGDLGFIGPGRMVKAFEDTAFKLADGKMSQPFRTQFGWHIVKVEEKRGSGDSLEVHARHILLQVQPGRDTVDSLRLVAEEFVEKAETDGFTTAANTHGIQASDTGFIAAGAFFPLLGNKTSGLVNSFREARIGQVSHVYDTERGLYAFALTDKRDAGVKPFDEVRTQIAGQVRQKKKLDLARARVQEFRNGVESKDALDKKAAADELRHTTTEPFSRDEFVPIVGNRNAFTGVAFKLPEGELSNVLVTQNGAYVLKVLERVEADSASFATDRKTIEGTLLEQKRTDLAEAWFSDLRDRAVIEDYRHRFYSEF